MIFDIQATMALAVKVRRLYLCLCPAPFRGLSGIGSSPEQEDLTSNSFG